MKQAMKTWEGCFEHANTCLQVCRSTQLMSSLFNIIPIITIVSRLNYQFFSCFCVVVGILGTNEQYNILTQDGYMILTNKSFLAPGLSIFFEQLDLSSSNCDEHRNSDSWVSPRQVFQSLRGLSSEKFQIFFPKNRPLEVCEYKILGHFTQPFSRYEFLNFGAFRSFQTWQHRGRAREKHETALV